MPQGLARVCPWFPPRRWGERLPNGTPTPPPVRKGHVPGTDPHPRRPNACASRTHRRRACPGRTPVGLSLAFRTPETPAGRSSGVRVDLNADMGESYGRWTLGDDPALMPYLTSANIACGFHGGDPHVMRN